MKIFIKLKEGKDEKSKEMSIITVNYNDKIIRKENNFIPMLQQIIIILCCA